ncbi:hypothetical protein B566_EDAN002118 [Ephemera danica]|nr:hypothetical protein B566_EDAN002118 [Ephemera danica]
MECHIAEDGVSQRVECASGQCECHPDAVVERQLQPQRLLFCFSSWPKSSQRDSLLSSHKKTIS